MSIYQQGSVWSPSEKVELLVNILQTAVPDLTGLLFHLIQERNILPKWSDTPLPKGRTLHASQITFEEISRSLRRQGPPPLQPIIPIPYQQILTPALQPKRSVSEQDPYTPAQRVLQPRPPRSTDSPMPPVTNGDAPSLARSAGGGDSSIDLPKKRGRPSKADVEQRDRMLAARGEVYQVKKRPSKKMRMSVGTPGMDVKAEPMLQTPLNQRVESKEDSSSGKRRLRRQRTDEGGQTDAGPEPLHTHVETPIEEEPTQVRSPSDRLLLASYRDRTGSAVTTERDTRHTPFSNENYDHTRDQG